MSGKTTKKTSRPKTRTVPDDLRREYRFDYKKARPNRFAPLLRGGTVAVILEPDIAAIFPDAEAVNRALRTLADAAPQRRRKRRSA